MRAYIAQRGVGNGAKCREMRGFGGGAGSQPYM